MANCGYKLQEFMAHSGNVNCLNLAKKKLGLFITGGDDHVVNLWSIGNPAALTSLCGHTSPIESVAFDLKEIFVVAGASAGAIKLWDLEEIKMVRSLGGHRSYCTAVEFHPFGEFFASGSKDTNLKIWDIRKKECIHTYKGHTRGISTVRFSPDGRWVVSGGFDNVVKIWDLTAGKLLHDFKLHEGHIRSIDFHPIEFLLATGSADRTVKFWDLETFELIGSSRSESTGVRSITFHPEGRTLFSGMDDSLKIYSWEPIVCHDTVNMGWSTLGDLCIQDGKLLGGSYHQNFVGVWMTDISLIETNSESSKPEPNSNCEQRPNFQEPSLQKVASFKRSTSTSSLRCVSPDDDTKDIKNIYVDTEGVNPVISRKVGSVKPSRNFSSSGAKEIKKSPTQTQVPAVDLPIKPSGQSITKSFIVPTVVPRDSSDWKQTPKPRKEPTSNAKAGIVTSTKPSHTRRPSNTTLDMERLPTSVEMKDTLDINIDSNFNSRLVADDARDSSEEKPMNTESVAGKCEKLSWSRTPADQKNSNESVDVSKGVKAVKYVNGVAVVRGRTRSLVERFERRENFQNDELQTPDSTPQAPPVAVKAPTIASPDLPPPIIPETVKEHMIPTPDLSPQIMLDILRAPTVVATDLPTKILLDTFKAPTPVVPDLPDTVNAPIMQAHNIPPRIMHDSSKAPRSATPDIPPRIMRDAAQACTIVAPELPDTFKTITSPVPDLPDTVKAPIMEAPNIPPWTMLDSTKAPSSTAPDIPPRIMRDAVQACTLVTPDLPDTFKEPISVAPDFPDTVKASIMQAPNIPSRIMHDSAKGPSSVAPDTPPRILHDAVPARTIVAPNLPSRPVPDTMKTSTMIDGFSKHHSARKISHMLKKSPRTSQPQMIRRESVVQSADAVTEDLMRNHDVFVSTLRSRLTKLQVVGHFLEQNDIKGAINATQKLPDHSVQADLINFLMEKMEILTLDLFLCLLPVLLSLLDSKAERHVNVSLELLIKLVAVFGPVISSMLSAPPGVGVNLQAEQRLECCNQCSILLQQIQKSLPALIRRGGLPAKCALELTLLLQDP